MKLIYIILFWMSLTMGLHESKIKIKEQVLSLLWLVYSALIGLLSLIGQSQSVVIGLLCSDWSDGSLCCDWSTLLWLVRWPLCCDWSTLPWLVRWSSLLWLVYSALIGQVIQSVMIGLLCSDWSDGSVCSVVIGLLCSDWSDDPVCFDWSTLMRFILLYIRWQLMMSSI